MKKIVIATKNQGKIREMMEAFQGLPVEVIPLAAFGELPDAVEDGETFEENSRIKAKFYMEHTGCACLADDSGLEITALGGAPGVYSARYAGYHAEDATNNQKMLEELCIADVEESPASYRCALTFLDTDGTVITTHGHCNGTIRKWPKGRGGFGYDPYFYTTEFSGRTMAELSLEEKDRISHRGRALRQMAAKLEAYLK